MKTLCTLTALTLALALSGCDSETQTSNDYPEGVAPIDESNAHLGTDAQAQSDEQPDIPSTDEPPDAAPDENAGDAAAADEHHAQGLAYTVPAGGSVGEPNASRVVTLLLEEEVAVMVSVWPGDVGGFEANLGRWLGQAGYDRADIAGIAQLRNTFETLTIGDVEGTWISLLDGQDGSAMIAVWVPREGQTWTIKINGSADALRNQQDTLRDWVQTLRFE